MICFHSLEDRIVKRFMRDAAHPPQPPKGVPVRAVDLPPPVLNLVGKAIFPSDAEVAVNPRCRSAVLRVAQKVSSAGTSRKHVDVQRRTSAALAEGRGPGGGNV